ncbi:MAG: DMT family transporter [Pseudomonadota bacterium]
MSNLNQAGLAPVNAAVLPTANSGAVALPAIVAGTQNLGATAAVPETFVKGLVMAGAAMFLYALMDACAKALAGAVDPWQIILVRSVFALALGFTMLAARREGLREVLRSGQPLLQIARGLTAVACMYCGILAVTMLSLAEALTIMYAAPIAVTLLSIPLLGEKVGVRRLSAVAVGFVGVLIVAGPGSGELGYGLPVALAAMLLYALATVMTRRLGRTDRGLTTHFYTQFVFLGISMPMMPFVWITPSFDQATILIGAGMCGAVAIYLLTEAHQAAPPAVVAPMDYTVILWGALLGMLVWGETPTATTWVGITIIAATGLYIAQREFATGPLNRFGPVYLWARRLLG